MRRSTTVAEHAVRYRLVAISGGSYGAADDMRLKVSTWSST